MSFLSETESLLGLAIFADNETLPTLVSKNSWTESIAEKLSLSTDFAKLSALEEEQVKSCVFPQELKFSVPVNLHDSKKAYLTLLSDELESEADEDFLRAWGLDKLDVDAGSKSTESGVYGVEP